VQNVINGGTSGGTGTISRTGGDVTITFPAAAGTTDHTALSNLAWTASGHSGTPARIAGFFEGGSAGYAGFGPGMYLDGDDNIAVSNDVLEGAAAGKTAVQPGALGDLASLDAIPLSLVTNAGTMAAEDAEDYIQTAHTGNVTINDLSINTNDGQATSAAMSLTTDGAQGGFDGMYIDARPTLGDGIFVYAIGYGLYVYVEGVDAGIYAYSVGGAGVYAESSTYPLAVEVGSPYTVGATGQYKTDFSTFGVTDGADASLIDGSTVTLKDDTAAGVWRVEGTATGGTQIVNFDAMAGMGYLTSESDTLQTVATRGATISNTIASTAAVPITWGGTNTFLARTGTISGTNSLYWTVGTTNYHLRLK
jgi:hypothetical protein